MVSQAGLARLHEAASVIDGLLPAVLVIDDDPACASHCSRMLDDLGYRHFCASTAREALELIGTHGNIQIVLADMEMPSMDGFVLVEEARARNGAGKPIAAIMLTDAITPNLAVRGLHIEAVDLLCKPLTFEAYAAAMRRAMRYLGARRGSSTESSMLDFGQQLARLVSVIEGSALEPQPEPRTSDKEISATLRAIIGSRSLRSRFFPGQFFADPAWDILLDLTRAKLEEQEVSVSSVCIAASVPMSTALRWVRQMTEAGLLRRWTDPKDRRRDLITLTDATTARMRDYLTSVHAMWKKV
jgi:CheY-like chemotaxis protein